MSRRVQGGFVVSMLVLLTACQNYNFNPVGHCTFQPGSTRITIENVATADVLFVVDDSSSMDPMQVGLANSFTSFVNQMVAINTERVNQGFEAIDFHIAVTSSSIAYAYQVSDTNPQYCLQQSGTQCCTVSTCSAASCTPGESCGGGNMCIAKLGDGGQTTECCSVGNCGSAGTGCFLGDQCADLTQPGGTTYFKGSRACNLGLVSNGQDYPAGNFMAAAGNPKVIHFGKDLAWDTWVPDETGSGGSTTDATLNLRINDFKENIMVGSCGSGQEQGIEAARLAIQKALAGEQDINVGEWPHQGAKMIVVWVGNEDDCSYRLDAPLTEVSGEPGADSCVFDKESVADSFDGRRLIPLAEYNSFFSGLVNPEGAGSFGAAFILAATFCDSEIGGGFTGMDKFYPQTECGGEPTLASCETPDTDDPATEINESVVHSQYPYYASGAGFRFIELDRMIKLKGYNTVEDSVCSVTATDGFGPKLAEIAELAKPPTTIRLDTAPAAGVITLLKIFRAAGGSTTCQYGEGKDWWFVENEGSTTAVPNPTQFVYINHMVGGNCEAEKGDTYSAEYIGMMPPQGCTSDQSCADALGETAAAWRCSFETTASTVGTCLCR